MKNLILNALLMLSFLTLLSCKHSSKKETAQTKRQVEKIARATPNEAAIHRVLDLDEVKCKGAEIEKLSRGKRHLSAYVETAPTKDDSNYWIKVAEDNGNSIVAYYTFAVDSKTLDVRYYDLMQGSLISIDQWRKTTPLDER